MLGLKDPGPRAHRLQLAAGLGACFAPCAQSPGWMLPAKPDRALLAAPRRVHQPRCARGKAALAPGAGTALGWAGQSWLEGAQLWTRELTPSRGSAP